MEAVAPAGKSGLASQGIGAIKDGVRIPLVVSLLALHATSPVRAEEVVTLGDSLTFAYEAEFGFRVTVPFSGTYGDNMPAHVRNWVEILGAPGYRSAWFDHGARKTFNLNFAPFGSNYTLLLRHENNWAIPGLRIAELRRFVLGEATFLDLVSESEDFALLGTALGLSDFEEEDFLVTDMEEQIADKAERLVFFIGGNDVRGIYGTVYNGGSAGSFSDDFIADADVVLARVRQLNPTIQIVVVAVPHIGITPDIKGSHPTDPVKTGRVTELLRDLNARLKALAEDYEAGFADIFSPTLSLLQPAPLCIHGIAFANDGSATGNLNHVWLNGELSANFHPNTHAQAVIANAIIDAFNRRYGTGIAPLSATEILGNLLGKSAAEIDMSFAEWSAAFGLAGQAETADTDHDGIPAGIEFALGLDPTFLDGDRVAMRLVTEPGPPVFELSYPRRLPASARYTLRATTNATLSGAFTPVTPEPAAGTDGLLRATIPAGARGFMRLESTVSP